MAFKFDVNDVLPDAKCDYCGEKGSLAALWHPEARPLFVCTQCLQSAIEAIEGSVHGGLKGTG